MALQTMYLDPNAQTYTDDQIVGKVNTAAVAISRADAIDGAALGSCNMDDLGDGSTNKGYTSTEQTKLGTIEDSATADQDGDEMVTAINGGSGSLTRETALSQEDLNIVKSAPTSGQFNVRDVYRDTDGKLGIVYDDVAV